MSRYRSEVLTYIEQNETADPLKIMLAASPFDDISSKEIAQQIMGRKIARRKFPFVLDHPQYRYPKKTSLEQASSEETARYKASLIAGDSLVDLTGGMGLDTYFFAQQVSSVIHVEADEALSEVVKYNFSILGTSIRTIHTTAECFLEDAEQSFDWLYIDPSRRVGGNRKTSIQNLVPNVVELQTKMLERGKNVLIKLSPMQDISEVLETLDHVKKIEVVAVKEEVKELLVHIEREHNGIAIIGFVVLVNGVKCTYQVKRDQLESASITSTQSYIYQPHPSMVKAGLHDHCAALLGLTKLHPNTQLFTSQELKTDWIGRIFSVESEMKLSKSEAKAIFPDGKANIISKNHPLSPSDIAKKLKIKEGGVKYIIACTTHDDKRKAYVCGRVSY